MAKYMVAVTEIIEYLVPVTARTEEEAGEIGERKIVNTRNRDKWCVDVRAREVEGVALATKPAVSSVAKKKYKNLAGYDGAGAQSSRT